MIAHDDHERRPTGHRVSPQLGLGVALVIAWWAVSWSRLEPLSDYYFFPIWLGYILTVDGLVQLRTGTSLWLRDHVRFVLLFVASVPFWWLFEAMNRFLQNWHYVTPHPISTLSYVLQASVSFSTVIPAVLETSELLASFHLGDRLPRLRVWRFGPRALVGFHLLGWVMLVLVVLAPHYAYPFAWLSVFFLIEPFNAAVGQRSIARFAAEGRWAAVWNVMLATVMTGFFWEMWNSRSMPKWTYSVPFVEFAHLFEMPVLGYLGYLPFGLELFACFGVVFWLVFRAPQRYSRVDQSEHDSDGPRRDLARAQPGTVRPGRPTTGHAGSSSAKDQRRAGG